MMKNSNKMQELDVLMTGQVWSTKHNVYMIVKSENDEVTYVDGHGDYRTTKKNAFIDFIAKVSTLSALK